LVIVLLLWAAAAAARVTVDDDVKDCPVVGLVSPEHRLTLNAFEVADAFEVPLDFLMNPAHHHRHAIDWPGVRREWFSMPYRDGAVERFVWGATAGMLRNFYRFLSAGA